MTIRVLLFGHYREAAPAVDAHGASLLQIRDGATAAAVAETLGARDARLVDLLQRTRVAVNGDFSDPATPLRDGDEVAFLPPMSGG